MRGGADIRVDPVPFTESELLAARLRLAARECVRALDAFARAWRQASANQRAHELGKAAARQARMDAAELYVLRSLRS